MSTGARRGIWVACSALLLALLAWLYQRYVWGSSAAELGWLWHGSTYRLIQPRMLGVVLIGPWFVVVLAWTLADLPWQQRLMAVLLRLGFVAALAVALARPVRSTESDKVAVVYLVDVSASVPNEALADAQRLVDEAYELKRDEDLVRVVTFARRPRLLAARPGTEAPAIERHQAVASAPAADAGSEGEAQPETPTATDPNAGSDLQAALQLAYGLLPPGYLKRVVLLSDGLQTRGDLLAEAHRAVEHGVRLFTLPYQRAVPGEVAVRALALPERLKVGETFAITADIYATRATTARVRLYQGETLNGLDGVRKLKLEAGSNAIRFKSVVRVPGEVTYALELSELGADRFSDNNRFSATVDVPGRPQVLYVEAAPRHAGPLSRALTAQQYDVDTRPPTGFPGSLRELERFDFVIVSDTPKERLSVGAQQLIEQYVRDLGGGFLFAGGENGYGLGGWQRTTLARMLPVRMETERRKEMPSVAMVLVIDRSGSMTGMPIEMAKEAAKATLDVLASDDVISVVAFDSQPYRYVKMQPARNRSRIRGLIGRIQPGGGTEIFSALDAAYNDLTVTPARKKHVILLTDGKAPASGIRDLVSAMIAESITVTTVGLGADVDEQMLRMIADVGGGRYHAVPDAQSLPRIFTKETEMVARAAAVEEWFPVEQTGYAAFLRKIDVRTSPYLHGYVSTQMKPPPATELLASADTAEPILARWRVGTGWSLAWTSDVKARWAVEWIGWPGWEKFWGQLVREHMRQKHRRELDMRTEMVGDELHATVDAFTVDERFDNHLKSTLAISGPQPGGETTRVQMRQTAPGRYQARAHLRRYGSFLLRAEHWRDDAAGPKRLVAVSTGHISNPYPREYAAFKPDLLSLRRAAAAAGGSFKPTDHAVFFSPAGEKIRHHEDLWSRAIMLALALFLLDLLIRRVRIFDRGFRPRRAPRGPGRAAAA